MEGESKLYDYKIIHHNDNTGEPEVILESSDQALALEFFLILLLTTMVGFYTRVYYKQRSDEKALRHFINDSDEVLSVVARDGSEVFMSNKAFGRLWGDTNKFRSGLSYKEFYKNPSLSIEKLLHNRSTVIASKKANNKLVLRASEIDWNGTPAVLLRGKAYDLEYDGTFPGRGGSTSSTAKTLAQGNSWTSSCRSWLSESVRSSRIPTKKNMSP